MMTEQPGEGSAPPPPYPGGPESGGPQAPPMELKGKPGRDVLNEVGCAK